MLKANDLSENVLIPFGLYLVTGLFLIPRVTDFPLWALYPFFCLFVLSGDNSDHFPAFSCRQF